MPYAQVNEGVADVSGVVGEATVRVFSGAYEETTVYGGSVTYNNTCTIIAEDGPVVIR